MINISRLNRYLLGLLLLISIISFKSCSKEELIYPVIITGMVKDIDENGAVFNARITNYDSNHTTEYGFAWSDKLNIQFSEMFKVISSNIDEQGIYSSLIDYSLSKDKTYNLISFTVYKGETYLGNKVFFTSLGARIPEIKKIIPDTVSWNDTILILGDNFGSFKEQTQVLIDSYPAPLLSVSNDSLVVVIPDEVSQSPASVEVIIAGNSAELAEGISVYPPISISSVTPGEGNYLQPITITGRNFSNRVYYSESAKRTMDNQLTRFRFNDSLISSTFINDSTVRLVLPSDMDGESLILLLKTPAQKAILSATNITR